jgi:hypothetical protein
MGELGRRWGVTYIPLIVYITKSARCIETNYGI